MNHSIQICMNLYFQATRVDQPFAACYEYATGAGRLVGAVFTHFSVGYIGGTHELKPDKCYKYLPRNLSKLDLLLRERQVTSLEFDQSPDEDIIGNSKVRVIIELSTLRPYRRLYIEFPKDDMPSIVDLANTIKTLIIDADRIVDIEYGFIAAMSKDKFPAVYFSDIFVSKRLTRDEMMSLAIWRSQSHQYSRKMRDIYCGNLLGEGHLNAAGDVDRFLTQLEGIIGKDKIIHIAPRKIYFYQPDSEDKKVLLRDLLESYSLLMHADGSELLPSF